MFFALAKNKNNKKYNKHLILIRLYVPVFLHDARHHPEVPLEQRCSLYHIPDWHL